MRSEDAAGGLKSPARKGKRMRHIGAEHADARTRRSAQGLWLAVGLVAILAGYPIGLALVSLGAPDWWSPVYMVLVVVAIVAAIGFARWMKHRELVQ